METLVFWAAGKQLLVTSEDRNLVFYDPMQFGFAKLLRNRVKNLDRVKVSAALGFVLKGHYWALAAAGSGRILPFAPIWVNGGIDWGVTGGGAIDLLNQKKWVLKCLNISLLQ